MQNFIFHNPVKIVFGTDAYDRIGKEAQKLGAKALVLIGKGSVKQNGVLDTVLAQLQSAGVTHVMVEGVKPNPVLSKVNEAIDVARKEQVDMIVAVGGGSVIDSAKAIAAGAQYDGDVWDFFVSKARAKQALPILAVLTLAATASEMNGSAVVTNEATKEKYSFGSPSTYPVASFLNPEVTYSVPADQTANGGVDAITHLLEPYFNNEYPRAVLQDNITEGMIRAIMVATEKALKDPRDYDARATIMWSASLALNGLTKSGMGKTDFPVHMIEHSLSALYDIAHAAGLAIVLPGWMEYTLDTNQGKIAQLGRNVFGLTQSDERACAEESIARLKEWFKSIGSPVSLEDAGISPDDIPAIAENAVGLANVWGMDAYTKEVIADVLDRCRS